MNTATDTPARRMVIRVRRTWAELGYAQRRLLEIRTGISLPSREERRADHSATGGG
jgi:hypothetical protein